MKNKEFSRKFILSVLAIGLLVYPFGLPRNCWAEDISVAATVDRKTVELGDSLQLTIAISNYQDVAPIKLPPIDGFDVRYLGPATHVSIINGQYSSMTALMYSLAALKTGKFKIPSLTLNLNGKDYSTDPIDVTVVDAGTAKQQSPTGQNTGNSVSLQDKLFVVMGLPKNEYYLGEPIPVTIKLFVNNVSVKDVQYPDFEHTGFTIADYQQPKKYVEAIGGIQYQIVEFKTFAYPTRTGDLTLGPTKIACNILFKSATDQHPSPGGLFDDDFFNNFFNNFDLRTVTAESSELKIKVLPLPEEGKPKGFSGAVGHFDFTASVGPAEVKVGDPLTVHMKVLGAGNLSAIAMPTVADANSFKLYDPQITDHPGEKTAEQVVIPKSVNVKEVPAVAFSYFDSDTKGYKTITRGPFPVGVKPLEKGEESKVVGLGQASPVQEPQEEALGHDIVFIKESLGAMEPVGFILTENIFYWLLMLLLLGIWLALFNYHRLSHRLKTDREFAQKLQAPKQARSGLLEAKVYMEKGAQKEFYDALFKMLQKYFAYKLQVAVGTVTTDAICAALATKVLHGPVADHVREVFAECEMVRYASFGVDREKMSVSYKKAQEIIDYFERNWR